MAILSDIDIKNAIHRKEIIIEPAVSDDQIGPGSIDFTLSNEFLILKENIRKGKVYDLKVITFEDLFETIKSESVIIKPGELILGKTLERVTLAPDICGWIQGRSRYARLGLSVHVASSFIQPGSSNRQILEIINFSSFPITIHSGMRICQIIFERTSTKTEKPYFKIGKFAKQ